MTAFLERPEMMLCRRSLAFPILPRCHRRTRRREGLVGQLLLAAGAHGHRILRLGPGIAGKAWPGRRRRLERRLGAGSRTALGAGDVELGAIKPERHVIGAEERCYAPLDA